MKKEEDFSALLDTLLAVIWGQCSDHMVTKLKTVKEMEKWKEKGDCGSLLKEIRKIASSYESQRNPFLIAVEGLKEIANHKQEERILVWELPHAEIGASFQQ